MNLTTDERTALRRVAEQALAHLESIPQDTDDLAASVVGGSNRDAFIPGETGNDLDIMVEDETLDSMLERGFNDIDASSFGVLHDDAHEEWALARTETKPDDAHGYKGIEIETKGVSLLEDLRRRDLRMNAMALQIQCGPPTTNAIDSEDIERIELNDGEDIAFFVDPFNGREDIRNGTIRHVSEAFTEDPIRVLRAARYVARFEGEPDVPEHLRDDVPDIVPFVIAPETKTLMRELAPELNRMSRDRIGEEIVKAMKQAKDPTRFWTALRETGALAVIAPNLDRATIVPAGPEKYHREGDTFTHTMMVLSQMHNLSEARDITGIDRVRRYMMAVAHDLGKVTLADEQGGLWSDDPPRRFGGHDQTGIADAKRLAASLGLDAHLSEVMQDAAELHMDVYDLPEWDPLTLVEFVDHYTPAEQAKTPYMATVEELIDMSEADHQGRFQNLDVFDSENAFTEDDDAPDGAARPAFNKTRFTDALTTARTAITEINGFEILRTGLCNEHANNGLGNDALAEQLARCETCRTPGPWVGENLTEQRYEYITSQSD